MTERVLPLSFAQERLWVAEQLAPGTPAYNLPFAVRLRGPLDAAALGRALDGVVRRHEALRTTFAVREGAPVQVVRAASPVPLPLDDLSRLPADARAARARRLALVMSRRGFDLRAGPLLRARLLRLDGDDHRLLLTVHHLVSDGASQEVVLRELAELYAAEAEGRAAALPPLGVQYGDYAAWQRGWLRGEVLEAMEGHWAARMRGAPALEVPADRPHPPVTSGRGGRHRFAVAADAARAARELGAAEAATPFAVLLAAFVLLLHRRTGLEDVVVGVPAGGRVEAELEPLAGFFVNSLPVRAAVHPGESFRVLVRRVRDTLVDALDHQELPFARMVELLRPARDPARNPLFEVMFSYQPGAPARTAAGVELRLEPTELAGAPMDLSLWVEEREGKLAGVMDYAADRFDPGTAARIAAEYTGLLDDALRRPDARLRDLRPGADAAPPVSAPAAGAGEARPAAPARPAAGRGGDDGFVPVHAVVAALAARAPDAPAVAFGGRTLSRGELEVRANRLARHLADRGVGPEGIVAVLAESTAETVVAMLAVLKAGGAFLLLDRGYPEARLRWMMRDSGARWLVAEGALPAGVGGGAVDRIDPAAEAERIAAREATPPAVEVGPDHVAYLVYTSGSTGTPKGAAVTHRGIPAVAAWPGARMGVGPGDRLLQFASFSFDAAVVDVFAALVSGATLVLAPRPALLPGPALMDTLRREAVTVVFLPPSALSLLEPGWLPALRVVVSVGEALGAAVAARWADELELHDAYGPTECTVCATSGRVRADGEDPPIGLPLPHVRARVLDAEGRPVPPGAPGELYLGGAGVARGYLGRPALTAERFVPDAAGPPGARLYRTGDRVRAGADGVLRFLGRTDQQVKVRGFRVEPGEVEAALAAHPAVRECVVGASGQGESAALSAWVVAAGRAHAAELRDHLRERLPPWMVPELWTFLDDMPRTPAGKVDRRALPAPDPAGASTAYVAPRTAAERVVAGLWAEMIGVERVGVHDDFFEAGGHSLLAARFAWRFQELVGVQAPPRLVFDAPTVESLVAALSPAYADAAALEETCALLLSVAGLSDDEAAERLAHPSHLADRPAP